MATLTDAVVVDAAPARLWDWLLHLAEHYRGWHPDHVRAEWLEGPPNRAGSVLLMVEGLHGRRHAMRVRVTAVEPERRLGYRFLGATRLLARSGEFRLEPFGDRTRFTAVLRFRWFAGLFRGRLAALRRHLAEEGASLRRMVEAGAPDPVGPIAAAARRG